MKSYTIYFIRNITTKENEEGRYVGQTDAKPTPEGIAELKKLCEDMVYPPVEAVFTSPLSRCTECAKIVYPDSTPLVIDGLIEYNFGEFDCRRADELQKQPTFPAWLAGEKGVAPPFGESNEAFARRICTCFEKIVDGLLKTGTHTAAIFTHGGVIMTLLAAYGFPQLPMTEWKCDNGNGFAVRVDASMWMRSKKVEVFSEFPYEKEEME